MGFMRGKTAGLRGCWETIPTARGSKSSTARARNSPRMSLELERTCPVCGEERAFYRAASTTLHLGKKVKWCCPECDYRFVRIDDEVDTGAA